MSQRPHNVVIICTDQQRYDSLGCTQNTFAQTPNIDGLAREGTLFHRHITAHPLCMPSRASFFTGRLPSSHGVWHNGLALSRKHEHHAAEYNNHIPTLVDVFQRGGYHTRSVGKLHFTPYLAHNFFECEEGHARWSDPAMASWHGPYYGFEHVSLTLGHGEYHPAGHYRAWLRANFPEADRALADPKPASAFPELYDVYPGVLPVEAHHSTWIGNEACSFIGSNEARKKPFLLYVSFPDPHHPFSPPAELAREFENRDVIPWHRGGGLDSKPQAWRTKGWCCPVGDDAALRRVRQYTDAMLHLIDRNVGRVIGALKSADLWEATVVVYTSDHGDFLGDFGLVRKNAVACRALNNVPFILRAPGVKLPAQTSAPMSNIDVLPTLCQLLDLKIPDGVQGRSVLPALSGESGRLAPVFAYHPEPKHHNFSVFGDRHRYTLYPGTGECELFDHAEDPHELNNRAGDPACKSIESELRQALLELHLRSDAPSGHRLCDW